MSLRHCADGSFWAQILLTLNATRATNVTGFVGTSPYSMSDTMKRTCKALEQVLRAIDDSCDRALACGSVIQGWGWCSL